MDDLLPLLGAAEERFPHRLSFVIDTGVGGDAAEPGVQRCVGLKLRKGLVGFQKYVLRGVLCIIGVAEHVTAEVVNLVLVFVDDLPESGGIAFIKAVDKIEII